MQPKQVAQATAKVLQSYLTYQAVRTIHNELSETNPAQAIWLSNYTASHNIQDDEVYLEGLMSENKEMVLRILTVREYIAEQVLDFLPEMVRSGINKGNMEHRRHLLERLTQTVAEPATPNSETTDLEFDSNDSSDS
jgi:hypothetical protein